MKKQRKIAEAARNRKDGAGEAKKAAQGCLGVEANVMIDITAMIGKEPTVAGLAATSCADFANWMRMTAKQALLTPIHARMATVGAAGGRDGSESLFDAGHHALMPLGSRSDLGEQFKLRAGRG